MGSEAQVPLLDGTTTRYINLDNAASTPPLRQVVKKVNVFCELYGSVHRGSGFASCIATEVYREAREIAGRFVGADPDTHTVIFVKNTTEAVNLLAGVYPVEAGDVILISGMEHHSNDLPWRGKADIKIIRTTDSGELDLDHFRDLAADCRGRLKLVAITGASNVTGCINPVHEIAAITHQAGARLFVDASQLAPHREIRMKPADDAEHIDFIAFSGHKMYAPFGSGVLIGPSDFFNQRPPYQSGGGTVRLVTEDEAYWQETPEKNEAGTPNVIGAVALATAAGFLQTLGFENISNHEEQLTEQLLKGLQAIRGVRVFGSPVADAGKRLGVVSFSVDHTHHALVAAVLSYEYGIGVRNGCFCAHPYVLHLLSPGETAVAGYKEQILRDDKQGAPGLVRVSTGLNNTPGDIDRLLLGLGQIATGAFSGDYVPGPDGSYTPRGWAYPCGDFFSFT